MAFVEALRARLTAGPSLHERALGWRELLRRSGGQLGNAPPPRQRDELEFLPAALEIVETPPSPTGRVLSVALCAFFVLALAWSCFGKIDVVATATGKIIPAGKTKTVQPLEIGIVRAILVGEGQTVKAGQVLIELDPTTSLADRDRLSGELITALTDMARLQAAADEREDGFRPPIKAPPAVADLARRLLASQLVEQRAKLAVLDRQAAQKTADAAAIAATINKLKAIIPLLKERVDGRKFLSDRNAGPRVAWLELSQELIDKEHELMVQRQRLAEAEAGRAAAEAGRVQAEAEFRRVVLNDLNLAREKAAGLGQELVKAEQRAVQQALTSPVDGTVQQVQVTTLGGVVTPAQPLMLIVPDGERLEVEASLQNKDIGFVEPGQPVEIKIDTFNFTRYGLLHGTVLSVSQDAIQRDRSGEVRPGTMTSPAPGQELVFTVRIRLDETRMRVGDKFVSLAPGMSVTAEIKTGSRQLIEYVLSPVLKMRHEAMRER